MSLMRPVRPKDYLVGSFSKIGKINIPCYFRVRGDGGKIIANIREHMGIGEVGWYRKDHLSLLGKLQSRELKLDCSLSTAQVLPTITFWSMCGIKGVREERNDAINKCYS